MNKREKHQLTYEFAVDLEERMTREIADSVINAPSVKDFDLHTVSMHQKIGGIKALRKVIFK